MEATDVETIGSTAPFVDRETYDKVCEAYDQKAQELVQMRDTMTGKMKLLVDLQSKRSEENYHVPKPLFNRIVSYLIKRPYDEVAPLIDGITDALGDEDA